MAQYLAPGVYVEEVSFRAPSIEGVGTSTAAFAGPTLTGPVNQTPELLTSFGDFQNIYGGYDNLAITGNAADAKNTNFLALSVKGFFDNGGSELYVSRVFVSSSATNTGIAASGTPGNNNVSGSRALSRRVRKSDCDGGHASGADAKRQRLAARFVDSDGPARRSLDRHA